MNLSLKERQVKNIQKKERKKERKKEKVNDINCQKEGIQMKNKDINKTQQKYPRKMKTKVEWRDKN